MQKKLIALAIAGLSGAAFAQSNVTVYGVADASYDFVNVSGGAAGADTPNYGRVSSNGSHIGFKGMESLGNGLTAVFQYEAAVNLDAGAGNGLLGGSRDSYIGLAGGFGTVILGSATGPTRALGQVMDVNTNKDATTSNKAVLGKMGGLLAGLNVTNIGGANLAGTGSNVVTGQARSSNGASIFDQYLPNVIAYVTPNFNGFQGTIGYVADENKSDVATSKVRTSALDLGLTYSNGPIWVGLTHGDIQVRNQDGGLAPTLAGTLSAVLGDNVRTKETRLGGKYDFGNATVRLMWSRNKTEAGGNLANPTGVDMKQTVWGIGGTYNVTANGKITAQYYNAKDITGNGTFNGGPLGVPNGNLATSDTGARFYSLGYEHSLSKRTMLVASYVHLKNDDNAIGYDFGNNSTGLAGPDVKLSAVQFGVRHSF